MADLRKPITVLIADDHAMTRKGVRAFLDQAPDIQVVGEARNGDETRRLVERLSPQILLLDLVMPKLSPAELEKWVRTNYPETITLVLTAHDRDAYLSTMMEAGAAGYLDKKLRAGQLISAIRRAEKSFSIRNNLKGRAAGGRRSPRNGKVYPSASAKCYRC